MIRRASWAMVRRRECLLPTPLGWVLLLLLVLGVFWVAIWNVYPFLAQTHRVASGPVVVEGWAGQEALLFALRERSTRGGPPLYITGGPMTVDLAAITHLDSYADLGAWRLRQLGATPEALQSVPGPLVRKDRTFASALALRDWLQTHGGIPPQLTLVSEGPHARRSRLLFERAFSRQARIGIISVPDPDYDARRWWAYSQGFRNVTDEFIAYLYARLFFWRSGD